MLTSPAVAQFDSAGSYSINFNIGAEVGARRFLVDVPLYEMYNKQLDIPRPGYNIGIKLQYSLSKNWQVCSGIVLNERSFGHRKNSICWPGPEPNCRFITILRYDSTKYLSRTWRFGYFYVPLEIYYTRQYKKVAIGGFAGGSFDYLGYYRYDVTEYDANNNGRSYTQKPSFDHYKKFGGSFLLGASVSYPVNKNFVLSAEPFARWCLPIFKAAGTSTNFYAFGLNFVIKHKI